MPNSTTPVPDPRGLTEKEVTEIAALVAALPGRWITETERTDADHLYAGLVAPRVDKRAFQITIGGAEGGGLTVGDWAGTVLAADVGMDEAFAVIREALGASGKAR